MAVHVQPLGPGRLTFGTGTGADANDASCQVTGMAVTSDKDSDDDVTTLCGDVAKGAIRYSFSLNGTLLQDYSDTGIGMYCWQHMGQAVPFVFVPSNAWGKQCSGTLVIDPIDFGSDTVGENQSADIEFAIVGTPEIIEIQTLPGGAPTTGGVVDTDAPAPAPVAPTAEDADAAQVSENAAAESAAEPAPVP